MKRIQIFLSVCALFVLAGSAYGWYFNDRIVPRTWVGAVAVGGFTRDEAAARIQGAVDALNAGGVQVNVEGTNEVIQSGAVSFDLNLTETVDGAFQYGHTGGWAARIGERIIALVYSRDVAAPVHIDDTALRTQVSDIADATDVELHDIRLQITGTRVKLLTDTKPGRAINQTEAFQKVHDALAALTSGPIVLALRDEIPVANPTTAPSAVDAAQKLLARALSLQYEDMQFFISRERLGSWITSQYDGDQLRPGLSREAIAAYVTTVAHGLNVAPQPPQITTDGGRITGFTPPKVGRAVEEDGLIQMIMDAVMARLGTDKVGLPAGQAGDTLLVPVKSTKMALTGLDSTTGIVELVGKATTPFTGSPKNRISNIKNGVKFLSGSVVQPGAEFSTLATLGTIDNTTGYLPELVIKGDRTQPEFGGGLCQVSTTLFRAVLNTGLPITMRRNHSYRVSYYEKDGDGKSIGPGLDATIYDPDVDFRFVNDMQTPVLIIGYVIGDRLTFELYGTKDGRTSTIIGPKLLSEIPPGDPLYIETTDLAPGVKKQVETPHAGGSATATYIITYADGHTATKTFTSYYRRWPAQYLLGVASLSVATPTPTPTQTP